MGILSQQSIGRGNLGTLKRDPFPRPPEWQTAKGGWGGFTYAKDKEQQALFHATSGAGHTNKNTGGPYSGWAFNHIPGETQYLDPALPPQYKYKEQTLLGQMAGLLDPANSSSPGNISDDAGSQAWAQSKAAAQIGHSFLGGTSSRSLRDTTQTSTKDPARPIYHASGGSQNGFDRDNKYGVSDYHSIPPVEPTPNVWRGVRTTSMTLEVEDTGLIMDNHSSQGDGGGKWDTLEGHSQHQPILKELGSPGQAGRPGELFRGTDRVRTGLRSLAAPLTTVS